MALASFDADNDGHPELICGWSHGRFDARHWQTGEVIFKEKLDSPHSIAALAVDDWLQMGHDQLIVCSQLGQGNARLLFLLILFYATLKNVNKRRILFDS